jgi:hypothetical protein
MNADLIFTIVGFGLALWFLFGFTWFLLFIKVTMPPAPWHPPLSAKIITVVAVSFNVPWAMLTRGSMPTGIIIMPDNLPVEERPQFERWLNGHCPCPACRERRGKV